MNTAMWIARLAYNFTTPNSLSGWGHQNLLACSAWSPGEWLWAMTREQTLHAVLQLQRDANLMTSNLNVLQQYVLSLH